MKDDDTTNTVDAAADYERHRVPYAPCVDYDASDWAPELVCDDCGWEGLYEDLEDMICCPNCGVPVFRVFLCGPYVLAVEPSNPKNTRVWVTDSEAPLMWEEVTFEDIPTSAGGVVSDAEYWGNHLLLFVDGRPLPALEDWRW